MASRTSGISAYFMGVGQWSWPVTVHRTVHAPRLTSHFGFGHGRTWGGAAPSWNGRSPGLSRPVDRFL